MTKVPSPNRPEVSPDICTLKDWPLALVNTSAAPAAPVMLSPAACSAAKIR